MYDGLGLRTIYLGDEAIIEPGAFSLEGRAIRKVRQSVSRLHKAGLHVPSCTELEPLDPETLREVETVLELGRLGAPGARLLDGDGLDPRQLRRDTLVVLARDGAARSAASFTSSRATGARRCRCRSCAVIPTRPTV